MSGLRRQIAGVLLGVVVSRLAISEARRINVGKASELLSKFNAHEENATVQRHESVSSRSGNLTTLHVSTASNLYEASAETPQAVAESSASELTATDPMAAIAGDLQTLSHPLSFENKPHETFAMLFSAVSLIFFLKVCFCDQVPTDKWNEVCEQHDELTNTYDREVDKLIEQLDSMASDTTVLAELNFQEKQRNFASILQKMFRNPAAKIRDAAQNRLIHQFRGFILVWLKINEQVSLDPINNPRHICSETSLRRCGTILELAQAVAERCKASPIQLIGEDVNGTSKLRQLLRMSDDSKRESSRRHMSRRCCFCCCRWIEWSCGFGAELNRDDEDGPFPFHVWLGVIKLTIFSKSHIFALVGLFLGLELAVMFSIMQRYVFAAPAGIAFVLHLVLLYQMDQQDMRHMLSKEIRYLQQKATGVARRRENVLQAYSKMQDLQNLWRYQTLPRLENFLCLLEMMRDLTPDIQEAMLGGAVERFERMGEAMGDLSLWIGPEALSEDVLRTVAAQIDECTKLVQKSLKKKKAVPYVLHHLGHTVGFLVVRIVACYDLPQRKSNEVYILIVLGKGTEDEGQQFRTKPVQDISNPRWRKPGGRDYEEFFSPVTPDTRSITFQILGDKIDGKVARFGFLVSNFRQDPGVWVRQREMLYDARTHKEQSQGEIEYEVFFANQVAHLDRLRKESAVETIDEFLNVV